MCMLFFCYWKFSLFSFFSLLLGNLFPTCTLHRTLQIHSYHVECDRQKLSSVRSSEAWWERWIQKVRVEHAGWYRVNSLQWTYVAWASHKSPRRPSQNRSEKCSRRWESFSCSRFVLHALFRDYSGSFHPREDQGKEVLKLTWRMHQRCTPTVVFLFQRSQTDRCLWTELQCLTF